MTARTRQALVALAAGGLLLLSPSIVVADQVGVTIKDLAFEPATVTVSVGAGVTWINEDAVSHTATADDGSFDTGTIRPGEDAGVTFQTVGTFPYHCEIHPSMKGTVVIEDAPAASQEPAPTDDPNIPPTDAVGGPTDRGGASTSGSGAPLLLILAGVLGVAFGYRRFTARS